jgi:hypothetical protein
MKPEYCRYAAIFDSALYSEHYILMGFVGFWCGLGPDLSAGLVTLDDSVHTRSV